MLGKSYVFSLIPVTLTDSAAGTAPLHSQEWAQRLHWLVLTILRVL